MLQCRSEFGVIAITPSTWCTCNLYKYNKTGKHVTNCKKVRIYASLLSSLTKQFLIIIYVMYVSYVSAVLPLKGPRTAHDAPIFIIVYGLLWPFFGVLAITLVWLQVHWCDCKYTGVIASTLVWLQSHQTRFYTATCILDQFVRI